MSRTGTVRPCSALVRNGSGQPPGGSPSSPLKADHRIGNVVVLRVLGEIIWVGANCNRVKRQIAHHLR